MNNKGVIYCYTSPSNKCYIGLTINELSRKRDHKRAAANMSNLPFHKAIRKYGFENFKYEILEVINSNSRKELKNLLNEAEIKYIKTYKEGGRTLYNGTNGGDGTVGRVVSEQERQNIRDRMLVYYNTLEGKNRLKRYSHPILQYDLLGNFIKEFPSLGSVKFVKDSSLCDYLAGRKHSVGNSLWALKTSGMDIIETGKTLFNKFTQETLRKRYIQKPILLIDIKTREIIREYNSPKEAATLTKILHIGECLRGSRKSAGGFMWIYKDSLNDKNETI